MTYALSDYQEISRDFLATRTFAGLFDSPGVGKTAPTIEAAAQRVKETGCPALITAPAYLLPNWAYEISRFAPGSTVTLANGQGYENRSDALNSGSDFVLTSYNNWSAGRGNGFQYDTLLTRTWAVFVYDEGHRLRGRSSRTFKHVQRIRRVGSPNSDTPIWTLTGTPIVNNPGDLWPLLNVWDRKRFGSYWKFVNYWCEITTTPWNTEVGQLSGGKEAEFQALMGEFSIRRTLEDVPALSNLEERHKHLQVEMPASVKKTIATARRDYIVEHEDMRRSEFVNNGGALYARLRQLATNPPTKAKPKIDLLKELLEDRPEPLVVYVWYKDSAKAVTEGLTKTTRPVTLITGDTPTHQRSSLADKWSHQQDGILVATIASLKEGISLVHSSTVIFLEHSELPADQEQCIARLKRRGQKTDLVNVIHVWAKGTPDTAIKRANVDRETGLKRALTDWLLEES